MSARMKKHHTKEPNDFFPFEKTLGKNIPWREVFKENLKGSEGGLMLKGGRYRAGLTQKELAEKIGVKTHHISEMEHGKRPIGKNMAQRLAKVFNIDYRVFL
jgi:ribosome-binding protein aMBF1 (putative translation factor)